MQIAPSPAEILFTDKIHCVLHLLSSQCSHSEYSDLQPPCLLCQNPHGLFTISLDTNSLQEGRTRLPLLPHISVNITGREC